jgi:hypothetical protein
MIEAPVHFFPKSRTFWLYQGSFLGAMIALQLIIDFGFRRKDLAFNLSAGAIWFPLYCLTCLYFRYRFKTRNWQRFGGLTFLGVNLLYAFIGACFINCVMFGITVPIFWDQYLSDTAIEKAGMSRAVLLSQMIIGNTVQTTLLTAAWSFVYVSIVSRRRIKETELHNLRLQNTLRENQLASLQNQLNPHFLFNALNNIRFLIHENPRNADETLTALSDILRYSLSSSKSGKVSIKEELLVLEKYLAIVKIQLESRLKFVCHVDESAEQALLPPMCVQLLIENAVKHGIDNLTNGGTIELKAERRDSKLCVRVKNPFPSNFSSKDGTGTGLENIRRRLTILYGEHASLDIHTQDNLFTATLVLPWETNSESTDY